MASKQLGKLRQWAGEVISSREKTTVTEEFRELEKDIELRRDGAHKLLAASDAYQYALSKKKKNEAFEDAEKLLPIDTLGIVMIVHGEEFGEDSAFGTSLVRLGRAHCKVATLQEAYALTFKDTFLTSVERFTDEIKEYEVQRKKLDSRRLSYDAAVAKFEKLKSSKKEKEKREAEDEMQRARQRYDETSDDVRAHMHAIQDDEIAQLRELSSFLDLEINFVQQYLNVLKDVKSDWHVDGSNVSKPRPPKTDGITHVFSRSSQEHGSVRSKRSHRSNSNIKESSDSSDDERQRSRSASASASRRPSVHRKSDSNASKPSSRPASRTSSRPTSRASRKRADSEGTIGENDDKEREREKSRRMSVAGWASNAVGSVTGRGKKSKDKFATLPDDVDHRGSGSGEADENGGGGEQQQHPLKKSGSFHSIGMKLTKDKSKESLQNASPKLAARILKPPSLQGRKVVRALHGFSGATDELTFRAGDEILVINEVLDGWWMGELNGTKGLFPTSYVEVLPTKPARSGSLGRGRDKGGESSLSSLESTRRTFDDSDNHSYLSSDIDEHHGMEIRPLAPSHSPFYGGPSDAISVSSSATDDEDDNKLFAPIQRGSPAMAAAAAAYRDGGRKFQSRSSGSSPQITGKVLPHSFNTPQPHLQPQPQPQPHQTRRYTMTDMSAPLRPITPPQPQPQSQSQSQSQPASSVKKAPPPPPPRRSPNPAQAAVGPPIPDRPFKSSRTQSAGSLKVFLPTSGSNSGSTPNSTPNSNSNLALPAAGYGVGGNRGHGYDRSPFESATELAAATAPIPSWAVCPVFKQSPFHDEGTCSNCLGLHRDV